MNKTDVFQPPEYRGVTPAEELALFAAFKNGDQSAGDRLFEAFAKLAWGIAVRNKKNFPMEDILNEAYLGLFDAMQRFNPARGRFSSYARTRIRGWVLDYINREVAVHRDCVSIEAFKEMEDENLERPLPKEMWVNPTEYGDDVHRDSLRRMIVQRILADFNPRHRELLLSYIGGPKLPELTKTHGLSRTRLWDIRKELHTRFKEVFTQFAKQNPELVERAGLLNFLSDKDCP